MTIILQVVFVIGSFASMIGALFATRTSGEPWTSLQSGLVGAAVILLIIALFMLITTYMRKKPKSMPIGSKINEYMYNWIDRGGVVAILSRNMSWVDNERIRDLLRLKAKSNELLLCLPHEIKLSQELGQLGAKVYTFSELQYTPQSRFTIINKDRMDAQVAVGLSRGPRHSIEEVSQGEHPIFSIADDLINLIIEFNKFKNQQGMKK